MALVGDRRVGRDRGGATAVVPVAQRDVRKASALDPAQRCAIERHRAKDDRGFPRIGLRRPPPGRPDRRQGTQPRRRGHLSRLGGHLAQRHPQCRDAAGLHQHPTAEIDRDQQGQQGLGAARRRGGRARHATVVRGVQSDHRRRQTHRRGKLVDGEPHRPRGNRRRPHRRRSAGPNADRAGHRRARAHRPADRLSQRDHHVVAVDHDRVVAGDRAVGGGRLLRR